MLGRAPLVIAVALCACRPDPPPTVAPAPASAHAARPEVRRALDELRRREPETLRDQVALCEIAAPPFEEAARAQAFARRLREVGLSDVRIDAEGNALGERRGSADGPVLLLAAHLDTVFPRGTDVRVRAEGPVLHGPGIGDDCRGLAVVLALARVMVDLDLPTRGTVIFAGDVGEEGLGDLRGVKHLFGHELRGRVTHFVSIDGTGLGITHRGVGSFRYLATFSGPGGHSYGAFGVPSAIHALGRAVSHLDAIEVPRAPKTTFNVGRIAGGTSINAIAHTATMEIDLRSESATALAELDVAVRKAIARGVAEENTGARAGSAPVTVEVRWLGKRPTGDQPVDAPIVRAAMAADAALSIASDLGAGSTDANLPMSLGIPAITIDGGGRGRGAHSLHEHFDTTDSHLGTQRALLTALEILGPLSPRDR